MTQSRKAALLLKILLLQKHDRSQGFSLLEVLAGMLVLSAFIAASMTAMATSVLVKERARTATEATNWIEQDLELVRNHATTVIYTLSASANRGQNRITLTNIYGLTAGERIAIAGDSTIYTIQSVSGNTINLTNNLFLAAAAGSGVIPISKCQPAATATRTAAEMGLGTVLQQSLPAVTSGGTRTLTPSNRTYTLSRTASVSPAAPFQVVQLTYTVTPQDSTRSIATMYTEVIPHAAFQCPNV